MTRFVMMAGLPGSGKSTKAKELADREAAVLHSSDSLREELFGDANNVDKNAVLFQELNRRINKDLSEGKNVIYDATNTSYKRRKLFLESLKQECFKECYMVATPYEKCLEQNLGRKRTVPEHVIEKMYKNFFVPQYYEGWDNIQVVFNDEIDQDLDALFKDLDGISQDNPHHTLTIGEHCRKCMENVKETGGGEILEMAALLHDIGKKFTKSFTDSKGNPSEEAHFYNHQNVSAYLSLFYLKHFSKEKMLETAAYIQWHMQPFNLGTGKARSKSVRLFGEEFCNNLEMLHQADIAAK